MKRLIVLTFIGFISGCSNYTVESNLSKQNIETYFKPSQVTIYDKSELLDKEYTVLGAVEGSSCQEASNDLPASEKEARTNARINASDMKANGIVFQTCLNFPQDEACVSNVICYGRALEVDVNDG